MSSLAIAPRSPLDPPITEQAETIEDVWSLFLWIGLGVLLMVVVLVFWVIVRYRRRSADMPRQNHVNIPIELTYTIVPFLVVIGLLAVTFVTVQAIDEVDEAPDLVVHVTAYQWSWEFDYPDAGVTVVDDSDTADPVLVLPADSTVRFDLESADVVHSFWLTAFRFKRDMIPGSPSSFSVDIGPETGAFPNAGVCAEYCGLDHAYMRFGVEVLSADDFAAWLADHQETDDEGAGS